MDILRWIEESLSPRLCNSEEFIYDDMDSQSGHSLPLIYVPFSASNRSHWRDRGSLYDYLYSVNGEGKRLLDFGPGDGWPSLLVAPFAGEVVGVDGSERRVLVCSENAKRLGVSNARFVHVAPGTPLPFDDGSFDGIMAASSIEQTPDPRATLRELVRVLRPGGRLRIAYESLAQYRMGHERDVWLWGIDAKSSRLILFDRDIEHERAHQYGLTYAKPKQELAKWFPTRNARLFFSMVDIRQLEALAPSLIDVRVCHTTHPAGQTFAKWLNEWELSSVTPTHSGATSAALLFNAISAKERPADLEGVDKLIAPVAKVAIQLAAPLNLDPLITATK